MHDLPWFLLFALMSLASGLFLVRQYRAGSPVQRRQIAWVGATSVAVALLALVAIALR